MKAHGASSPTPADPNNLQSPFFSPLRASELTTPNGALFPFGISFKNNSSS